MIERCAGVNLRFVKTGRSRRSQWFTKWDEWRESGADPYTPSQVSLAKGRAKLIVWKGKPCTQNMASTPYFALGILFFAALGFGLAPLGLAWLWGKVFSPAKPNPIKNSIYECGLESKGDAWVQFRSEYYLYAMIFLIFDVETIFLFPWAVKFKALGVFGLVEMLIFLAILIVGYIWIWTKGALDWV